MGNKKEVKEIILGMRDVNETKERRRKSGA
jgi:hypothetical protein